MNPPRTSCFIANLIALNQWHDYEFRTWLLKRGMGFNDPSKWWGDQGARPTRHEGLDLTCFRDNAGNEQQLTAGTIVPPLYEGKVINIIDDFLGRTVIIEHRLSNQTGQILHGFYAHLTPTAKLKTGAFIDDTAELGMIAEGNRICPAHLHISMVWISRDFPVDCLSWPGFTEQEGFHPCDPLVFI